GPFRSVSRTITRLIRASTCLRAKWRRRMMWARITSPGKRFPPWISNRMMILLFQGDPCQDRVQTVVHATSLPLPKGSYPESQGEDPCGEARNHEHRPRVDAAFRFDDRRAIHSAPQPALGPDAGAMGRPGPGAGRARGPTPGRPGDNPARPDARVDLPSTS